MTANFQSIVVLLIAAGLLSVGHGLHGSLVGVRASAEAFSAATTGIIMSGYSAGLLLSSWATPWIVRSVGHIRVFAGFASVVSVVVLLIPLWINPIWWFLMRFIAGLCTSGLFIVCESWLNSTATNENRGKILSLYMIVTYAAIGSGQLLLNVSDASGFSRFIIVSALLSLAIVPLSLLNTEAPSLAGARRVQLGEIWRASPLAVVATLASGMGQSAFFAMGAVYGLMQGLSLPYVSIMMALPPLGVIVSQYPAGLLSDRYDRRSIILVLAALTVVVAALAVIIGPASPEILIALMTLFGTIALPVYSLVVAHANDHLQKEQMLGASGKLILLYGLGAIFGPLAAGQFMSRLGNSGFMLFMMMCYGVIAGFAFWRRLQKPENLKAKADDAIKVGPVSTPVAAQVMTENGPGTGG